LYWMNIIQLKIQLNLKALHFIFLIIWILFLLSLRNGLFANSKTRLHTILPSSDSDRIVINEIMFWPEPGGIEWIELMNISQESIDIQNWKIADADTTRFYILALQSQIMTPNSLLVLTKDKSLAYRYPIPDGVLVIMEAFPSLNNSGDSFFLFDSKGRIIDFVAYHEDWGQAGFSIERVNLFGNESDDSNWQVSADINGATPGLPNSVRKVHDVSKIQLTVEPNPFSPDGDGIDDSAEISYTLTSAYSTIVLYVYDVLGRRIRTLRAGSQSGPQGSIYWGGKNDNGKTAPVGIYILFLQGLNNQQGVVESAKTTVVLAGER